MHLETLDWLIVVAYALFALCVGLWFKKRAEGGVENFFLSGRTLPWWIAGTSMVATTFASDTPLVITGWVRDAGIWKNWLWWAYAAGGMLTVFLFARYWRRGEVLTTAELAELRYGDRGAGVLRGFLGFYHAGITNTIILCWVLVAAAKIMDVTFGVQKDEALVIACALALSYSLLAGFWGVVVTDLVQFVMAMTGAICLAYLSWTAIGGSEAVLAAAAEGGQFTAETLSFVPRAGASSFLDPAFWTNSVTAIAVYLGVGWWAYELVDGGGLAVQRISASRDEREGVFAALWYNIAHYALRPWPWILVAVASLLVLPHVEVRAPRAGTVLEVRQDEAGRDEAIVVDLAPSTDPGAGPDVERAVLELPPHAEDWAPRSLVSAGDEFVGDAVLARTDSERAYVVMMTRYLPTGLLGLVVASLLAAFMSTVDTHVNLASSYFVNDLYRRFLDPEASERRLVLVARIASAVVLVLGATMAMANDSISNLFTFFLSFLGGVGPVYVLRWLWWRVRASTEIAAMVASSVTTTVLVVADGYVHLGDHGGWTSGGDLEHHARLCIVVVVSLAAALGSLYLTKTPDPRTLVQFYRRVRPMGWWRPVAVLCPEVHVERELVPIAIGTVGSLAMIYGVMIGVGQWFLDQPFLPALVAAIVGLAATTWALSRIRLERAPAGS